MFDSTLPQKPKLNKYKLEIYFFSFWAVPVFALRTHRGALTFPSAVQDSISSEISHVRVAGPFAAPPFYDGFVVFPLNTVAVMNTTELVVEIRPKKNSDPYGIWTHDLCDTGAALYQLSQQAN